MITVCVYWVRLLGYEGRTVKFGVNTEQLVYANCGWVRTAAVGHNAPQSRGWECS